MNYPTDWNDILGLVCECDNYESRHPDYLALEFNCTCDFNLEEIADKLAYNSISEFINDYREGLI